MPWDPADAPKKTKKAKTPKLRRQWSDIANRMLASGASDQSAIMAADGVIAKEARK